MHFISNLVAIMDRLGVDHDYVYKTFFKNNISTIAVLG